MNDINAMTPTQKGNAQQYAEMLYNLGWNKNAVIAVMVNGYHESGLNPSSVNSIGASGIFQWLNSWNVPLGDWHAQLQHLNDDNGQYIAHRPHEPASLRSVNNWNDFKHFEGASIGDMVRGFLWNWERPSEPEALPRDAVADSDANFMQGVIGNKITLQVPQWPFYDYAIQFTQGPFQNNPSANDHNDNCAYDLQSNDISYRAPYYAPVDMVQTYAQFPTATRVFESKTEVYRANGTTGRLGFVIAHDEDPSHYQVGKEYKQGDLLGNMGAGGMATGIHVHISTVNLGKDDHVKWRRGRFVSDIIGVAKGDNANAGGDLPNPYITLDEANNLGMMTANNVYSVTDEQKAKMKNVLGAHVNIGGFHFVANAGGGGGQPPEPEKPKPKHSKPLTGAGIFNVVNFN